LTNTFLSTEVNYKVSYMYCVKDQLLFFSKLCVMVISLSYYVPAVCILFM